MRKPIYLATFLLALCASGFAQKNELAFVLGGKITPSVGATTNQTTFSKTFAFEANYAAELADVGAAALHLEFPFVAAPASTKLTTSNLTAVKDYSSYFFTPALRLKAVPKAAFSPWLSAGGGIAHFNPGSTTVGGITTTVKSTTKSAVQLGAGADIHPPLLPVAFRAEVRDVYTGIPNLNTIGIKVRHNLFVGGGIVLRF
jgi:hypothetical protein